MERYENEDEKGDENGEDGHGPRSNCDQGKDHCHDAGYERYLGNDGRKLDAPAHMPIIVMPATGGNRCDSLTHFDHRRYYQSMHDLIFAVGPEKSFSPRHTYRGALTLKL